MIPHENHVSLNDRSPQQRKVLHLVSQLITIEFFTSSLFLLFCFILHIFVGNNPFFPWSNLLIFLTTLITCLFRPLLSVSLLVFIIPFTSNISAQIKALWRLEVFSLDLLSIDASIGFLAGLLFLHIFTRKWKFRPENLPSKTRILTFLLLSFQILILITVAIAISRNLYQSASPYSLKGFFYNLANIRYTSWLYDYFPLRDLFIFTTVIALSLGLLTLIRTKAQFNRSVLFPLLAATVIILNYALLSRLMNIGYNNGMSAEFGVTSFFPDIHAYGGYAVMAFVGGLYYLNYSKTHVKIAAGAFCLLALVGIIVSSSRFSIVTLFIALLIYVFFLIFKNNKKHLLALVFITLITVTAAGALSYWGTRGLFDSLAQASKAQSFETLSFALSDRPEIFRATLLMYSHYPILGLGKGSFNRDNSILEFSKSPFFASYPGENAHNYFFQLLAETGLVGLSLFGAIFLYQGLYLRNQSNQIITILILGIFSGNIYGHSLLIPNILVLLFILIGASNTEVQDEIIVVKSSNIFYKARFYCILAVATILIISATSEVKNSYGKTPFQQRFGCYKQVYYPDKHTSGLLKGKYKVVGSNLNIEYTVYHPDTYRHPLLIEFNLEQEGQKIASEKRMINSPGQYKERLDISRGHSGSEILLQIKTSRCLTPINLGLNLDNRRLGVQLNKVYQNN
jgi:O-antigen ligase